jgi:AcrR family transcriptional regulator
MTKPGDEQRTRLLRKAVQFASVEGLETLSFGRLALKLRRSKSSLAGLFGSKLDLQLALVNAAAGVFRERVTERIVAEPGLRRLHQLMDAWVSYLDEFEGGCFFCAAAFEFDDRPGSVRDAVAAATQSALTTLRKEIHLAQRLGEVAAETSPEQLAFELHAMILEANLTRRLLKDRDAHARARRAIRDRLDRVTAAN